MTSSQEYTRKQKLQIKKNRQRYFRVVEYFDFSGILDKSPIEIMEGYVISDKDTYELFASFSFKNISEKPIKALTVKLHLYNISNIPYAKLPFVYSFDNMSFGLRNKNESRPGEKKKHRANKKESNYIDIGETFGRTAYIKLPNDYFKRIELEIVDITYKNNEKEELSLMVDNKYRRISDLDDDRKYALSKIQESDHINQEYPAKVLPEITTTAWLCCCGTKNSVSNEVCEACSRDREWLLDNYNIKKMDTVSDTLRFESDLYYKGKIKHSQTKYMTTKEEMEHKAKEYEKAIERIAEEERKKERLKLSLVPRIVFFMLAVGALTFILYLVYMNTR